VGKPSGDAALRHTRMVVVRAETAAAARLARDRRFRDVLREGKSILFVRSTSS
jgi:hypothetical protein